MKKLALKIGFLLCTFPIFAQILEISRIEELVPHIDSKTLVVFDLDNTILTPAQELGNDQWFNFTLKEHVHDGFSFREAIDRVLPLYMDIMLASDVKAVESMTPSLIFNLQKKGIKVIGLTTRNVPLAYRTIDQLKSLDIDFSRSPLLVNENIKTHYPSNYIEGIFFLGGAHKGDALREFCSFIGYEPQRIIFINDKEKYVKQMAESFSDVDYIGLRYGAWDEQVALFDPKIAKVQLKYFKKIIPNEEVKKILTLQGK
jgi:phosphoserine phosphatase